MPSFQNSYEQDEKNLDPVMKLDTHDLQANLAFSSNIDQFFEPDYTALNKNSSNLAYHQTTSKSSLLKSSDCFKSPVLPNAESFSNTTEPYSEALTSSQTTSSDEEKKLAAEKFFAMIDEEDEKMRRMNLGVESENQSKRQAHDDHGSPFSQKMPLNSMDDDQIPKLDTAGPNSTTNSDSAFQYGYYFPSQQLPNSLYVNQTYYEPNLTGLAPYDHQAPMISLNSSGFYQNGLLNLPGQSQMPQTPHSNVFQKGISSGRSSRSKNEGGQNSQNNSHHHRSLPQYFWQINSHSSNRGTSPTPQKLNSTTTNNNLPKTEQSSSITINNHQVSNDAHQTQSNQNSANSQQNSSNNGSKLKGRNLRASLAEAELEKTESSILKQDVQERIPDPVKLIMLREKMATITRALDNLQRVDSSTDAMRAMKKKEKNRLASKCCRLKKKALFEANLVIKKGLSIERQSMEQLLDNIRQVVRAHIRGESTQTPLRMKVEQLIFEMREKMPRVAGRTQEFVAEVVDSTPNQLMMSNANAANFINGHN